MAEKSCSLTEFVGTAIGDTLGLVIANVDAALLEAMKLEKRYRSIGILGARTGAGPHIMAADEAVKATNTEVVSIELPRDTKGGAGHGSLIVLGGNDVSDVKRGIEVALKELDRTFGDVYGNEAGHIELQYTARASYAPGKSVRRPTGPRLRHYRRRPGVRWRADGRYRAEISQRRGGGLQLTGPRHQFQQRSHSGDFRRLRRGAPGGDLRPGNRQNRTGDAGRRTEKRSPLLHLIPARLIHEIEKI